MQNEKGLGAVQGAEAVNPQVKDQSQPTPLDRVVQAFEARMREMERKLAALETENRKLKRQIADAYDWSQEVTA